MITSRLLRLWNVRSAVKLSSRTLRTCVKSYSSGSSNQVNISQEMTSRITMNDPQTPPSNINPLITGMRTHTCQDLSLDLVGQRVTICGWLHHSRFKGRFLVLRDSYGLVQVRVAEKSLCQRVPNLESVVRISGILRQRPPGQENKAMSTGDVEVEADDLQVLNVCSPNIPILIHDKAPEASENVRLQYRYLDLRQERLHTILKMRSTFLLNMRKHLCEEEHFVDVETPTMFRRTPGGAREFLVPSHNFPGHCYALTQSPQQFKQLLMVGGFDRYMQVARCYRDEMSRPDRQPEFTQLDLEMAFLTRQDIQGVVERTLKSAWPSNIVERLPPTPFPRMSWMEAMARYGSDKPDLTIADELTLNTAVWRQEGDAQAGWINVSTGDLGDAEQEVQTVLRDHLHSGWAVVGLVCPVNTIPEILEALTSDASLLEESRIKLFHMIPAPSPEDVLEVFSTYDVDPAMTEALQHWAWKLVQKAAPHGTSSGCLLVVSSAGCLPSWNVAGKLRLDFANALQNHGLLERKLGFHFLWVDDFPLFSRNEEGRLESSHHPFTAPLLGHEERLFTAPETVLGQHYDLVCNGHEVAGGSIRIHQANMQRHVLENILQEDPTELEHLLQALSFGAPPHGGIALGIDRLVALLSGAETIRDTIAFPKSSTGRDIMSGAPALVKTSELKYYHLAHLTTQQEEDTETPESVANEEN